MLPNGLPMHLMSLHFPYTHDFNMDYHYNAERWDDRSLEEDINEVMKRKVIRGGSWKDVAYFVQNSTRTFEYQDTSKSYIGFRCVVDFLGRDKRFSIKKLII